MASPNQIVITGSSGAWMRRVSISAGVVTLESQTYGFNNVSALGMKGIRPESASASEEYVDVSRGDGALFKAIKKKLEIEIPTNAVLSGDSASGAGAKGQIRFTLNEGKYIPAVVGPPAVPATAETIVKLFNEVEPYLASPWLVGIPLGYTADGDLAGVAYLLGALDADLDYNVDAYTPAKLALSFTGKNLLPLEETETTKLETTGFTAVAPAGGQTYGAATITPTALEAGDGAKLAAGRLAVKI